MYIQIQYMTTSENFTIFTIPPDKLSNVIALRHIETYWGEDDDLSVISKSGDGTDPNEFQNTIKQLNRSKYFVGFVSVFILMIYMMQSIGSYVFL